MLDWIPRRCLQLLESSPKELPSPDVSPVAASLYNDEDASSGDSYVEIETGSPSPTDLS